MWGYSFFDFFWKRKEKIRILKLMSHKEGLIYLFLHNLTSICFGAIILISIFSLLIYKTLDWSISILIAVLIFYTFLTQSVFRKFILIKYGFYKKKIFKIFSLFWSVVNLIGFFSLIIYVSGLVPISFEQTLIYFLNDSIGLLFFGQILFWYQIKYLNLKKN